LLVLFGVGYYSSASSVLSPCGEGWRGGGEVERCLAGFSLSWLNSSDAVLGLEMFSLRPLPCVAGEGGVVGEGVALQLLALADVEPVLVRVGAVKSSYFFPVDCLALLEADARVLRESLRLLGGGVVLDVYVRVCSPRAVSNVGAVDRSPDVRVLLDAVKLWSDRIFVAALLIYLVFRSLSSGVDGVGDGLLV
jgi:hypothetical protein